MKGSSTKSWQDKTNNVTKERLPTKPPVRMTPQTSKDDSDLAQPKDSLIQPPGSTGEVRIVEAAQPVGSDAIGQVNSMNANGRLGNAVKTVPAASTFSTPSTSKSVTLADESHVKSKPAIAIRADSSAEIVPLASTSCQGEKHLKALSVNLSLATYPKERKGAVAEEPCRSAFGHETSETFSEAGQPQTAPSSPSISRHEKAEDLPTLHTLQENVENDCTLTSVTQSTYRKRNQTSDAILRARTSSKKRKADVLPPPLDDSDTIVVVPRSTAKARSLQKSHTFLRSSSRKARKLSVNGSPAALARPSVSSDHSPLSLQSTPSLSKSNRPTSFKAYKGPALKVLVSGSTTVDGKKNAMASFRSFGGSVTKSIKNADVLCVSSGALKKTTKLVMAIALGKYVVDERWLDESHRKRTLLDPVTFIPKDSEHECEWGFDLKAAIVRGRSGLGSLLGATSFYFTRQLKSDLGANFKDFCKIAEVLGAEDMGINLPRNGSTGGTVLVIGVDNDPQAPILRGLGARLHEKDLLVMGVLRGRIDLESNDFVIEAPIKSEADG